MIPYFNSIRVNLYYNNNNDNEKRSIGSIRYKINNAFKLNGGFGRNFKSDGETVALFGIQWGIDFGSSVSLGSN
ncbi:hypothetical protein [Psychroserpens luteus]|uniref:Uncharacterized protein n=1 Tax=Psychroserpens luteus TaxID=1434066 RepID=A0ABW5ZXZ5_9FLAO|nr:hypothetical protein [Psychroserpens luteus]